MLEEKIRGAIWRREIASIGGAVHQVKVGKESLEVWLGCKGLAGSVSGHFVEHINNIEEQESAMGGFVGLERAVYVLVQLGLSGV
jgi:hypothetical protein